MNIRTLAASAAAFVVVAVIFPGHIQAQGHIEGNVGKPATIESRSTPQPGRSIITQSGLAALLLSDTSVVIEMTDEGLRSLTKETETPPSHGVGAILSSMLKAGVTGLFDRGISVPLSALDHATAEDGTIYLFDRDGKLVFDTMKLNDTVPMHDFSRADAASFAKKINSAIKKNRSH